MPNTYRKWKPELRERFLAALTACGNVCAAAGLCGASRQSVYRLRATDPDFARDWDAALVRREDNDRRVFDGLWREWMDRQAAARSGPGSNPWTPSAL